VKEGEIRALLKTLDGEKRGGKSAIKESEQMREWL
jgi:hypothetical protein